VGDSTPSPTNNSTVNAAPEGPPLLSIRKRGQRLLNKAAVETRCVKIGDPEKPHGEGTSRSDCVAATASTSVNGVVVLRLTTPSGRRRDSGTYHCGADSADGRRGSFLTRTSLASVTDVPAELRAA